MVDATLFDYLWQYFVLFVAIYMLHVPHNDSSVLQVVHYSLVDEWKQYCSDSNELTSMQRHRLFLLPVIVFQENSVVQQSKIIVLLLLWDINARKYCIDPYELLPTEHRELMHISV